ncbi:MAG TPA: TPM domain-containing protein, partial [Methylomirabilota bacterium]|nr:TPM domain-containing protein [Methylomirabilota bacterium]
MLPAVVLALALAVPSVPPGRVADYAGVLTPREAEKLESRLAERERATGVQMVVAVFPSLAGESLEDYSIRLAGQWRIGRRGLDDGVIFLVFVEERRMRLEVGYGLEAVLPDAAAGRIIREAVAPHFRQRRYADGLQAGVDAVFERVGGGAPAPPAPGRRVPGWWGVWLFPLFVVFW